MQDVSAKTKSTIVIVTEEVCSKKANTPKDRAIGAIMGTFIGDALGVGPHWYYDMDQLKKDYGEWIDDYTSPKAGRYHMGLTAGENSQTGQVVGFLLESLAGLGNYGEI